ncbi:SAP domain-containing protein [Caerostris extrusa]|uniref:SAP domain-containing protein n=1 Tax=Caerostris extrusa TaxID=172846 RepID=A0AAV4NH32_CAEEX|nr:SAP domain-containing protein [Caerostris extrusa]
MQSLTKRLGLITNIERKGLTSSCKQLTAKRLGNLRVVDLKQELEKRGLSKSGSKKDLVKRLKAQLEFEKLCGERKAGECDLKLDLDADTEKNEFVQQYLAQQQKIYAEQKAVKRLVELEETLKSSDEKESCDSAKEDEIPSVNEVLTELDKSNGNNSRENFSVQNSDTTSETLEETNGSESPQSPSTVPLPTEEPIEENGNHQRNQLILPEISPDVPADPSIEIAECNNSIELQESQIVSPGIAVVPTDPMIEIFTTDHSNSSVTNTKCSDVVTSQEDLIVSSEFIQNVPDDSSVENTVDSSYQKVSFEVKDMLINSSVEINTDSSHQEVSSEMKDTPVDSSVKINTDSSHQQVSSEMKDTHLDSSVEINTDSSHQEVSSEMKDTHVDSSTYPRPSDLHLWWRDYPDVLDPQG